MPLIILLMCGLFIYLFVPIGGVILISIIFAVVILNYQKTLKMNEDIKAIKKHFDLMTPQEAEDYEINKHLERYNDLSEQEIQKINKEIEEDIEKELDDNDHPQIKR